MILEESSWKFVTINTYRGLYELTSVISISDGYRAAGDQQDNLLHRRYPCDREHCGGASAKSGKRPRETPEIWHMSQES